MRVLVGGVTGQEVLIVIRKTVFMANEQQEY